jgi:hypothetical protein
VRSAYIIDRRAGSSVLAVQAMSVEEHEVRHETPFVPFSSTRKSRSTDVLAGRTSLRVQDTNTTVRGPRHPRVPPLAFVYCSVSSSAAACVLSRAFVLSRCPVTARLDPLLLCLTSSPYHTDNQLRM